MTAAKSVRFSLLLLMLLGFSPLTEPVGAASKDFWSMSQEESIEEYKRELQGKAEAGSVKAQLFLGQMALQSGKQPDLEKAAYWYGKAAPQVAAAQDFLEMIRVTKTADLTNPQDLYWMGKAYLNGLFGRDHTKEGSHWLLLAAAQGQEDAREWSFEITAQERPRFKQDALVLIKTHQLSITEAALDQVLSSNPTADRVRSIFAVPLPRGEEYNLVSFNQYGDEALKRCIARAEQGDEYAQVSLAQAYQDGEHFAPENPAEAVRWYLKAAESKHELFHPRPAVFNQLARIYENGYGAPRSLEQARAWRQKAA